MSSAVARRYTRGLFAVAQAHEKVEAVDAGLATVAQALQDNPRFQALLESPVVSEADKQRMLAEVFAFAVDPLVQRFLRLLVSRGRSDQIRAVAAAFHDLAEAAAGRVEVTVESAFPLADAELQALQERLSAALHRQARAQVVVNPELMAGVRIRLGHRVLDATVLGALHQFEQRMANRSAGA
ncbi:MAG: ATP synthase F1 subunit delta [Alicyclobacillus sp.]|nr:ATP synthase F1 subunit delta [Alicyclobacillus sp.]